MRYIAIQRYFCVLLYIILFHIDKYCLCYFMIFSNMLLFSFSVTLCYCIASFIILWCVYIAMLCDVIVLVYYYYYDAVATDYDDDYYYKYEAGVVSMMVEE